MNEQSPGQPAAGHTDLPTTTNQVLIREVPKGPLEADHFALQVAQLPALGQGDVLVETLAITIGAGQRAGLQGSAGYAGPAESDVVMTGTGVGRVLASNHDAIAPDDIVMGLTGWSEHAVLTGDRLSIVDSTVAPSTLLGALGTNGLTAYFGLLDVGDPQPGETVVVSAAGGSVGHLVGQIAKRRGCTVVGVAGSDEKCASLIDDLGFDRAVNYKSTDFRAEFKAATPDRIDIYFDNTGGDILGSALFRMNTHGRIVCCGVVSQYDTASPDPGPRGVPGLLVNNRVRMQGFLVFDYADRFAEARAEISSWLASGDITARTTEFNGLSAAPRAFVDLLAGRTVGTTVINVASPTTPQP